MLNKLAHSGWGTRFSGQNQLAQTFSIIHKWDKPKTFRGVFSSHCSRRRKNLPKVGKKINTAHGPGKIRQVNVITKKISIEMEDGRIIEMTTDQFKPEMTGNKQAPNGEEQ
jgi:hypothetical protein